MQRKQTLLPWLALAAVALGAPAARGQADDLKAVLEQQAQRVAVVEKVKPSVVAVFAQGGKGGGSGVLISDDGYALTNFHVVEPTGPVMKCGLADGVLYDAVLVGWDKVGDVALIKLLPKKEGEKFRYAPMGDSDTVREGDWSLAMGNPFLLATDFTPTVTFGMVSGIHRYQYPSGTILEYTDCIQIDTSINPGNSGGPLYNMKGELIGINGRGSFDKRGRINSGVGYAISINQIKNFMGHLKAGLDADHATLGALVVTQTGRDGLARMEVTSILEESDAARRGLDYGDELVSFDGRLITSTNHYKNVLGLYPRGWRVPLEYRRGGERTEVLVRLMGAQRKELAPEGEKEKGPKAVQVKQPVTGPAAKLYEPKPGFVNYYFNKQMQDRVFAAFEKLGGYPDRTGPWTLAGKIRLKQLNSESPVTIEVRDEKSTDGSGAEAVVRMRIDSFPYMLKPLLSGQDPTELKQPAGSGGFLAAMYLYRKLLTEGREGFSVECYHGGYQPIYPPPDSGKPPEKWRDQKVMAEVIHTRHGPYLTDWYFSPEDQKLLAFDVYLERNTDPCEVYLGDYRPVGGKLFPHRIHVRHSDGHYGTINLQSVDMAAK